MDLVVGLNTAVLIPPKRLGFWARLWRALSPKSAFDRAFERLSEVADLLRIDARSEVPHLLRVDAVPAETRDAGLVVVRELEDTLGRFSHSTAVHFMPSVSRQAKPSIHFMAAPGQPGALIVKTWQPDCSDRKAVLAKIFKIPAKNVDRLVSELETLVMRERTNLAVIAEWLAAPTGAPYWASTPNSNDQVA